MLQPASVPLECQENPPSDCENCVLCAASNRAHSWRNSGRVFLDRVRQNGKTGAEYIFQGISERSKLYEEAHPKTFEILRNCGRKVLYVLIIVLDNLKHVCRKGISGAKSTYANIKSSSVASVQRMKPFLINNTKGFYFCGAAMWAAGIGFYVLPMFDIDFYDYSSKYFICSLLFMFAGGCLISLPLYCLWDTSTHHNRLDDHISQTQFMDKPPIYESLPPGFSSLPTASLEDEAPPTYEEISSSDHQGLLHTSDWVPPYALHQPSGNFSTHNAQNDTFVIPVDTVHVPIVVPVDTVHVPIVVPVGTTEPIVMSSASRETSVDECQKTSHSNFTNLQKSKSMGDLYERK